MFLSESHINERIEPFDSFYIIVSRAIRINQKKMKLFQGFALSFIVGSEGRRKGLKGEDHEIAIKHFHGLT